MVYKWLGWFGARRFDENTWSHCIGTCWDHDQIDEDVKIWCFRCWSSIMCVCVHYIRITHEENKLEDWNS